MLFVSKDRIFNSFLYNAQRSLTTVFKLYKAVLSIIIFPWN